MTTAGITGALANPAFSCPVCGGQRYSRLQCGTSSFDWFTSSYFRCDNCDFAFTEPRLYTAENYTARSTHAAFSAEGV